MVEKRYRTSAAVPLARDPLVRYRRFLDSKVAHTAVDANRAVVKQPVSRYGYHAI